MASETSTFSAEAVPGRLAAARASCKIRPVVMIFNSKPRHPSQNTKKPRKLHATAPGKAFAFVNTSRPGKADEETRRLVKTHVMQNVLRRKSQGFSKLEVNFLPSLCLSENSPQPIRSSPQAPPSYLLTFPIHTEPYMLKMVHDYAGAMLPTKSKVVDSAWFPLVMTDAALFHAILCTSALFGLHDMMLHRKHMLESIRLINDRLPGEWATSDATISAILFMAKAEYLQGNHSAWCVHMDGVKRIIELRGGTMTLSCLIQHKIYSTDLLGCMEIGALPRFPAIDILKPVSSSYPYNLPPAVVSLAKSFILDHELLALLSEITTHMKSSPTSHDTLGDQYRLLSLCYQQPLRDCLVLTKRFSSQVQQVKSKIVQEVLMIGALLFLSLPHMCALPPIRPVDYSYLLSRLDSFASPLYADHQILLQHPEFLLWLSFLGVVFSSTSVSLSAGAHERSPFRLQLRAVSIMLEITSWHDMKIALGRMWSIDPKYEKPYRCLWENAVFGHDICYES